MSKREEHSSLLAQFHSVSEAREKVRRELQTFVSSAASGDVLSVSEFFPLGEPYFFQFMNNLPAMSYIKDAHGRYVFINQSYAHLLGDDQEAFVGKCTDDLWPADVAGRFLEDDRHVLSTGETLEVERRVRTMCGREMFLRVSKFPLVVGDERVALGGFVMDMTTEVQARNALRQSERRYRTMVEHTFDCESWVDGEGNPIYINQACEQVTGYCAEELMHGQAGFEHIFHRDDLAAYRDYMRNSRREDGRSPDLRIFRKDGRLRWVCIVSRVVHGDDGENQGVRYSMRDITDRKYMEKRLEYEALHDPMTGLPNRALCLDRLSQALVRSQRREDYYFAVVFVDLDRFKIINDSMGHAFGDKVLQEAGLRLLRSVRDFDTVCRYGGDEFVLLLEELDRPREAVRVIRRLREAMSETFVVEDREIRLSASYGLVLGHGDGLGGTTPEALVQNANIALHRAKEVGPDHLKVFNARMLDTAMERMNLEADMRRDIAAGSFFLEYQPIYSLRCRKLIGFEALVRWRHETKGVISPAEFIPLAEDCGLINELGQWVLRQACSTLVRWRSVLPEARDLIISINLSGKQFNRFDLVDRVSSCLAQTGLPPQCLKLEITESSIMQNAEAAIGVLHRLKAMGIKVSIDDFGTGYSSMSYLKRFPLDHLKIDLSFVQGMDSSAENMEIVKAIITLAHSLGLKVIAEGVEKEEHQHLLSGLNCEYGQGFFYSRPVMEGCAREFIGPALVN